MCDDVNAFVADMKKKGVATSPLHEERWGILTQITLPSGGKLGVYQPKHASPLDAPKRAATKATRAKKTSAPKPKKPAKKAKSAKKAKKRASR
jgi:hypothetical protein